MCNRYAEYYAEAGVRVFTGCGKENLWKHIGEIYKILEAYGTFDVCHIRLTEESVTHYRTASLTDLALSCRPYFRGS